MMSGGENTCHMYSKMSNHSNFEWCFDFFKKEDIKQFIKETIKPFVNIIYNEIYVYVWFICFYNVFLIFITLANLFILIKMYKLMGVKMKTS